MQKIFAVSLAVLMLAMATPASAETGTGTYSFGGGVSEGSTGISPGLIACSGEPEEELCEELGLSPIGGANVEVNGQYSNVIVSGNDAASGSDVSMAACLYNPEGDTRCDDDDVASDVGCGGVSILGAPHTNNEVSVFIYSLHVGADLTTCFATTGEVTASFF